jgi:hypothetical protein
MLNNITNYTNLINTHKVRIALDPTDLFTIGVRDSNFYGNYQPALITAANLASSIGGLLPSPITLTTTGTTGVATLIGTTLNVPNYSLPYWFEYNQSDLTIWNNGKGNISSNTSYGQLALRLNATGASNTAIGTSAMQSTTTGNFNSAFGHEALLTNSTGSQNVAIGYQALKSNTTAASNVAIGHQALDVNTTGTNNLAIGADALGSNITASNNIAIGTASLVQNITGSSNTGIGVTALGSNTTGSGNYAIGYAALGLNTIGNYNTTVGNQALYSTTTVVASLGPITPGSGYTDGTYTDIELDYVSGSTCSNRPHVNITVTGGIVTACTLTGSIASVDRGTGFKDISTVMTSYLIGPGTGFTISPATLLTGESNIGIGYNVAAFNETGDDNIVIGNNALRRSTSSSNMIVIGHNALSNFTFNASNTIAIGNNTASSNRSGCIILGAGAAASANNQFAVGSAATNAGTVVTAAQTQTKYWDVVINGVAERILLA